jgi:Tfp pilus assembly protein PilE
MKKAWTLIELIFIILIVGFLSIGAINSIPDNTLLNNTNFVYNKILEKKANAIAFEADMSKEEENRRVCITFTNNAIKNDEKFSKVKFNLSNRVTVSARNSTTSISTICFDYLGRPYAGDVNLSSFDNLLHNEVNVSVNYNVDDTEKNITIYPMTGYVEIK